MIGYFSCMPLPGVKGTSWLSGRHVILFSKEKNYVPSDSHHLAGSKNKRSQWQLRLTCTINKVCT